MAEGKGKRGDDLQPGEIPRPEDPSLAAAQPPERRFKREGEMSRGKDYPMQIRESKAEYDPADPNRILRGDGAPD